MNEPLYLVGRILKPRGLKGEVKVLPVTDYPESFSDRTVLYTGKTTNAAVRRTVAGASLQKGMVYLRFDGIDSREGAEQLSGSMIFVPESDLMPLPPDRAYLHELIGLKVVDVNGAVCGTVKDVLRMPAHEVYEIDTGTGCILFPAIDEFVIEVDLEQGVMVVERFEEFL
ncbi:ribosome maturation factor RimM [Prosthecochloris sp. HL-130-GSB]|jgi:16S rRNA processing protein RimM|uniref:ribosome maturation factor RimM n=1 Tax=Prosthecochloris sp. HL-130-GSB TaxID=1974213 RepID=UPI000A1C0B62|nr:ribosome maturation factor RimM [Prosthecochloris sp. HL-130-GSB]ARM30982.1 16S rRNA processing protein RimM [Prosthecochloris sp. HL-130-GSB]